MTRSVLVILFVFVAAMVMTTGCGDNDTFTIEGSVEGNPSMNLRFIYFDNTTLRKDVTAVRDGKFEYKGVASVPTIVEITDNDYRPLGRVYVGNGQHIKCKISRGNLLAFSATGNDITKRWTDFLTANSKSLPSDDNRIANSTIAQYVKSHPDDIVSTLLMLTSYDASDDAAGADSLMSAIEHTARPAILVDRFNALLQRLVAQDAAKQVAPIPFYNRHDSLVDFRPSARPYSILAISSDKSGRSDSIVAAFKRLSRKALRSKLQIADFSTDNDTIAWHRSIKSDSASWQQGWAPAAIASPGINRLGIPSIPYFIVIDSAGNQLLRTKAISKAETYIDSCINATK